MADEDTRTLKEKLLFYTTAFFILLGIFSLFAFLFLVPFVIEPGFTTIFMQFDTRPALCVTLDSVAKRGVSNCTWSSCKEGCTKELFECFQIRVKYKADRNRTNNNTAVEVEPTSNYRAAVVGRQHQVKFNDEEDGDDAHYRKSRAIRDYNYDDTESYYKDTSASLMSKIVHKDSITYNEESLDDETLDDMYDSEFVGNGTGIHSEWFFGARLFPNVKGCGYPPSLNCTIWTKKYKTKGTNFSCYYSKVDPALVISDLDMWQNTLNLIYSMAIPIPSFIISVIYLAVAYFKIYNDDEEQVPLDKNAEEIADDDELGATNSADSCDQGVEEDELDELDGDELGDDEICIVLESGSGSLPEGLLSIAPVESGQLQQSNSGPLPLTNSTELPSSVRAQLIDEGGSRGSTEHGIISNSGSIPG